MKKYSNMRLLGIDFGKRKIGLAYSEGFLPSPLSTIEVKTQRQALSEIQAICERLSINKIVIGVSGGALDNETRIFGRILSGQMNIPVEFVDETLTSRDAVTKMVEGKTTQKKRREMEDEVAATLILNTYLEQNPKS